MTILGTEHERRETVVGCLIWISARLDQCVSAQIMTVLAAEHHRGPAISLGVTGVGAALDQQSCYFDGPFLLDVLVNFRTVLISPQGVPITNTKDIAQNIRRAQVA